MTGDVIVKVQRPIVAHHGAGDWLIYAEGRKNTAIIAPDKMPMHVRAQMRDDLKGYFLATLEGANNWTIYNRIEEQS